MPASKYMLTEREQRRDAAAEAAPIKACTYKRGRLYEFDPSVVTRPPCLCAPSHRGSTSHHCKFQSHRRRRFRVGEKEGLLKRIGQSCARRAQDQSRQPMPALGMGAVSEMEPEHPMRRVMIIVIMMMQCRYFSSNSYFNLRKRILGLLAERALHDDSLTYTFCLVTTHFADRKMSKYHIDNVV